MDSLLTGLILFLLLMLLSGLLAAAEIAIAAFGTNKIEELKEKKDPLAHSFESIQRDSESFFGTVQIITTTSLLASAILAYHIALKTLYPLLQKSGIQWLTDYAYFVTFIITLIIVSAFAIIAGILIPKSLGFKYAELIGKITVRGLIFLTFIFRYPAKMLTAISNVILKPFNDSTNFSESRLSEDEIRIILSDGLKSGVIDKTEHEIISNIFEFNDLKAREVMIPRTDMTAVDILNDKDEIIREIIRSGHSLVPVYENLPDNIIGVIHTKDIVIAMIDNGSLDLRQLIRPGYFVPDSKLISDILKEMQKRGERLAIVTDEYGGTEGVITMEDILEEIVGEFKSEDAAEQSFYTKLPDGKYYVLGSMYIDDFNEVFNFNLSVSEDYNTVAGFVSDKTGKILNIGETFQYENIVFELIKKLRQKMVQFKVFSVEGSLSEKTPSQTN